MYVCLQRVTSTLEVIEKIKQTKNIVCFNVYIPRLVYFRRFTGFSSDWPISKDMFNLLCKHYRCHLLKSSSQYAFVYIWLKMTGTYWLPVISRPGRFASQVFSRPGHLAPRRFASSCFSHLYNVLITLWSMSLFNSIA